MTHLKHLLPIIALAATSAAAAQVEILGDYSFAIDSAGERVTIKIDELRNASRTESTGPLFVSLRDTQCDDPASAGLPALEAEEDDDRPGVYPLDRWDPDGDSSLAPGDSLTNIEFTTKYLAPPSGTYRRHLVVYGLDYSKSEEGVLELVGSASFSRRHVQRGTDDIDSCFSAHPLEVGGSHRDYLSLGDRGTTIEFGLTRRARSRSISTAMSVPSANCSAPGGNCWKAYTSAARPTAS